MATGKRSGEILKRPDWACVRALYKGMGYSDYDLDRPLIGLANSWNRVVPGHSNLDQVAEYVSQGILQAGGTPVEFGVIGACDGIANGHDGMKYILPSRDIIAHSVELMVQAHRLDAVVLLGSCDKIVPGLLMAAARLDIPAIFVNGGPMLGGCEFDGRASDNSSLPEAFAMLTAGKISREEYDRLEEGSMPTCGSCSFLGTANTMCAVAEAMGMALPGSSMVPAVLAERLRVAQRTGRAIVDLVEKGITARRILDAEGIENGLRLGMAIGGSTNLALHIPAIAYEAGLDFFIDRIDRIGRSTPHLAKIYPAGAKNVPDFYEAGGVPAVMKHLMPLLNLDAETCDGGRTWREILASVPEVTNAVVKPLGAPWHDWGSLAILRGNLAPASAVTKPIAIADPMLEFSGPARVFDSEEDASEAVLAGKIKEGDVLVVRYEGPKGGPGMREMARLMKMLYGAGLALKTALVTDGRFSGTNNGCFVGHVSPEAWEGGPIALVRNGDPVTIDIPGGRLTLGVGEADLEARRKTWKRPEKFVPAGYLRVYARNAESADKGAVLRTRD